MPSGRYIELRVRLDDYDEFSLDAVPSLLTANGELVSPSSDQALDLALATQALRPDEVRWWIELSYASVGTPAFDGISYPLRSDPFVTDIFLFRVCDLPRRHKRAG